MRMHRTEPCALALGLALLAGCDAGPPRGDDSARTIAAPAATRHDDDALRRAIATQAQDVPVTGRGTVVRVLGDDLHGSRHQRFILQLASGGTVLVAHNIDIAPRLGSLDPGEPVEFAGEYAWNPRGGVVHWTHHDPGGRHRGGWLRHEGVTVR